MSSRTKKKDRNEAERRFHASKKREREQRKAERKQTKTDEPTPEATP